jgi:tetratricopeptide (TPR) repeat protein
LCAAVENVANPSATSRPKPRSPDNRAILWKRLGAALLAVSVIGLGYFGWKSFAPAVGTPTVTVVAADSSRESRELAGDLLIKLAKLQSATANLRLIDSDSKDGEHADLKFEVRGSSAAKVARASLALTSEKDRMILWSSGFEVPDGNRTNLQLQLSYTAARLVTCAMEALPPRGPRLSRDLLRPYLNGCAILGERQGYDSSQAIPLFAMVTEKAPKFEPAWAKLLLVETEQYLAVPADQVEQVAAQLRKHIIQARRINPELIEAFVAQSELAPGDAFTQRSRLLERALAIDPHNVYALSARASFYQQVGRMGAAVDDAQRAAQVDPLSPALRYFHIAALAYAGRMPAAEAALVEAEKLWPGATTIIDARYRLRLRYGDAAEAMRMQDSGAIQAGGRMRESFLLARINPTSANVENAIATAWSIYRRDPLGIGELIQALGEFNREEELFQVLTNWQRKEQIPFFADVLFRPPMKELWHDPRFMQVGKTLGLLGYWRSSENWPDFCADPDLPYDCKEEAAKLR